MIKRLSVTIFLVLIVMSFIGLYVGHFLLKESSTPPPIPANTPSTEDKPLYPAVQYNHLTQDINDNRQEINILEIDTKRAKVQAVLAHDSIFGFEKLSSIAKRTDAYAAVTAGFFREYGQPYGLVTRDKEVITSSNGKFPTFLIENGIPHIRDLTLKAWLSQGNTRVGITSINTLEKPGSVVLYTPAYGQDNRCSLKNITAVIENNTVKKIVRNSMDISIPQSGMLLTFYSPSSHDLKGIPLKAGEAITLEFSPELDSISQAYECGSWIIKDGKSVVKKIDPIIGLLTNRDPRTVIGINNDGHVVLVTIDGRQPGHSIGVTGSELAGFLLSIGVKDAAMLDGGASTEMIVNDKIVNRPSYEGKERLLGGGIVVKTS